MRPRLKNCCPLSEMASGSVVANGLTGTGHTIESCVRLVGTPNSPPVSLAIRLHMWISARRLKIETRNRSRLRLLIVARTVLAKREREREREACE